MRFVGLTLCLLASSFAARAESAEERLSALEARVKSLEQALLEVGGKVPAASSAVSASLEDSRPTATSAISAGQNGPGEPLGLVSIS